MTLPIGEANEIVGWFAVGQAIEVRTRVVTDDEPIFYLGEFIRPSQSGKSKSRYQLLRIVRDNMLVTAYIYLGPAHKFHADQFQIPGGDPYTGQVWHTVAELQAIADELRSRKPRRELEPADLQGAFRNMVEERKKRTRHQSTSWAGGFIQR